MITHINTNELSNLLGRIILIDVREEAEFKSGFIPTSINMPLGLLIDNIDFFDKRNIYYIICKSGNRSLNACMLLREHGFKVVNVSGGIVKYKGKLNRKIN